MAFCMFKFYDSWIILLFAWFVSYTSCEEVHKNNADNDWNWDHWTPFDGTSPPISFRTYGPPGDDDDFHDRHFETSNDTPIFLIIFVPIVIVIVLVVIGRFACKDQCSGNDGRSYSSSSTLHPPLRPSTTYSARPTTYSANYNFSSRGTTARITPSGIPAGSISSIPHISVPTVQPSAPYYSGPYAVNSDESSALDKPPDYSTVVFDDLIEKEEKFPIVKKMESAPPKYDEKY